jgi:hypothetical protein
MKGYEGFSCNSVKTSLRFKAITSKSFISFHILLILILKKKNHKQLIIKILSQK